MSSDQTGSRISQVTDMFSTLHVHTLLPHDAMHSELMAVIRHLSVCLSICLSDTVVYCTDMAKDTIQLFSQLGNTIILYFLCPSGVTKFQEKATQQRRYIQGE